VLAALRAELLVLRKRRVVWALVVLTPVLALLSGYVIEYVLYRTVTPSQYDTLGTPGQLLPDLLPHHFVDTAANSVDNTVPFVILGALMAGGDWDHGTVRTALLQGPSRVRNFAGQAAAMAVALAVSVALTFTVACAASALIGLTQAGPHSLGPGAFPAAGIVVRGLGAGLLIASVFGAAGLLLGTLLRSVSGAIAVALLWEIAVFPALQNVSYQVGGIARAVADAAPETSAGCLTGFFDTPAGGGRNSVYCLISPTVSVWVLTGWAATFLASAAFLLRRRDLTHDAGRRAPRSLPVKALAAAAVVRRRTGPPTTPLPVQRPGGVLVSTRAELVALARWPAVWAFALITPVNTLLTGYLIQYVFYRTADSGTFADLSADQLKPTLLPGKFVTVALNNVGPTGTQGFDGTVPLLLLGALVAGSDWGRGTIRTAVLQGPGRVRTALGQVLAVMVTLALSVVGTFVVCATASEVLAIALTGSWSPSAGPFPGGTDVLQGLASALLVSTAYGAAGLALGAVFRSAGAATGAVLLWTIVVTPVLDQVAVQLHGVAQTLYEVLPDANTLTLTHLGGITSNNANPTLSVAPTMAIAVLIAYALTFLAIPVLLIRRRDIT
jgi:ABC-2 type transport system permease protein